MIEVAVSWGAIVLCGVAAMVLGSIWYSPMTPIGRAWIKESGHTKESMEKAMKQGMAWRYVLAFVGSLVTAYVISHFADYLVVKNLNDGMTMVFWLWLGIAVPILLGDVLWDNKTWKLFAINAGYQLVLLLVMGSIIASMNG